MIKEQKYDQIKINIARGEIGSRNKKLVIKLLQAKIIQLYSVQAPIETEYLGDMQHFLRVAVSFRRLYF